MDSLITPFTFVVIVFASSLQYFAYKNKAGYKNPAAAKVMFYQQLMSATWISFFFVQPLEKISPTLQYGVSMGIIIASLIAYYFLEKKLLSAAKEVKE